MLVTLLLILFALLGAPLFAVIAAGALWGFYSADIDLSAVLIEFYRIAEMPILIAIPLFTFAGYLLSESRAPHRLVEITRALLGWMPGGLALVSLVACAMFTAFTGASGVTIVALGALLYPALKASGYSDNFSLGLVTTSGSLGLLFAPALPLILYAVVAQQLGIADNITIDNMFLAGILPGLLMLTLLVAMSLWSVRSNQLTPFSSQKALQAIREAIWEIPLPFIVLGGIYGGFLAISEAAAITALYILVVEVFIHREIPLKKLPDVMRDSMLMVGGILIILGLSLASTNYLIDAEIPTQLFDIVREHVSDKLTFLLLLNLFLLVLGTMLDIFSALVLIVPLLVLMFASDFLSQSLWLYALPVFNVYLAIDQIIKAQITPLALAVTWLSSLLFITLATYWASRNFSDEGVLFRN